MWCQERSCRITSCQREEIRNTNRVLKKFTERRVSLEGRMPPLVPPTGHQLPSPLQNPPPSLSLSKMFMCPVSVQQTPQLHGRRTSLSTRIQAGGERPMKETSVACGDVSYTCAPTGADTGPEAEMRLPHLQV